MKTLFIIPARGGSKGIPKKNIRSLNGKPLILYSIDIARNFANDEDICVSTDCDEITAVVERYGLSVPFKRPAALSTDTAGTYDVILHALKYFEDLNKTYDNILLLQPTSPFRTQKHISDIFNLYSADLDMVVSVGKSHQNPYFNLFEENEFGFLEKSKKGLFKNRQEAPPVFFYNGSMYLINVMALKERPLYNFEKIKKYTLDDLYSIDIDTELDWALCETIIKEGYIKNNEIL